MKRFIMAILMLTIIFSAFNAFAFNIVKIKKDISTYDDVRKFHNELSRHYVDDFTEIRDVVYLDVVFCRNLSAQVTKEKDLNVDNILISHKTDGEDEYYDFRVSNFYVGGWNPTLPDDRCSGIGENGGIQLKGFFLNLHAQIYRQGNSVINLHGIAPEKFLR